MTDKEWVEQELAQYQKLEIEAVKLVAKAKKKLAKAKAELDAAKGCLAEIRGGMKEFEFQKEYLTEYGRLP
jgi:hypothetical protein